MPRPETERARYLRRTMTKLEWRLWNHLRGRQLGGQKFRRQAPIGPYIADFVCLSARLVVEVDGPYHDERMAEDRRRTAWLESHGYRVLGFSDFEVEEELDGVLGVIEAALQDREGLLS